MPALLLPNHILSLPAEAADRLLAQGSGDAALLYLALLRHDGWESARRALGWTDQRASEAFALLVKLGLAQGDPVQEAPPRPADQPPSYQRSDLMNALREDSTFAGVTQMVESMLARPSPRPTCSPSTPFTTIWPYPARSSGMLTQACVADTERKYGPGRSPGCPWSKRPLFNGSGWGWTRRRPPRNTCARQQALLGREAELLPLLGIHGRAPVDPGAAVHRRLGGDGLRQRGHPSGL